MGSQQIISLPPYTFRLRLAQLVIAVLILILNIVSIAVLGGYGAFSYGIFTPIATCIIVAYWYHANYRRQHTYNRWVILILDCFAVLWWLSLFGVLANWAAAWAYVDSIDNAYGLGDLGSIKVVYALTTVAAVLGAAEFVLFVVTLVTFSIRLSAARRSEHQNQNTHGTPFANPNYQQMHDERSQTAGPKPGFEISHA